MLSSYTCGLCKSSSYRHSMSQSLSHSRVFFRPKPVNFSISIYRKYTTTLLKSCNFSSNIQIAFHIIWSEILDTRYQNQIFFFQIKTCLFFLLYVAEKIMLIKTKQKQSKQFISTFFTKKTFLWISSFLSETFAGLVFLFKRGETTPIVSDFLILLNFKGRSPHNFEVLLDIQ